MTIRIVHNPANWPQVLLRVFEQSMTCEFASLTREGAPLTYPLTPYIGDDERTLDVSTGLTYPAKAERARRNPKVALLYSYPAGSGIQSPPVVLVKGHATVRDANLQANTDRYMRLSAAKTPWLYQSIPPMMLRGLGWYYARIWIQVTPLSILWWPGGRLDQPPQRWDAPAGTGAPPSDPRPQGKALANWATQPTDWRAAALYAAKKLGTPVLTLVGDDGFPLPYRVRHATLTADGFHLTPPAGVPTLAGVACLTFHSHPERFTGQENRVFVGQATPDARGIHFSVERQVADWSLGGNSLSRIWSFVGKQGRLKPRLEAEAARHGQAVPQVRLPNEL